MRNAVDISVSGVKEITSALQDMAKNLQKRAEVAVLRAGAKPILRAARSFVPVGHSTYPPSGILKRSLGITVKKGSKQYYTARVGPRTGFSIYGIPRFGKKHGFRRWTKDPLFYGRLVATGTKHSKANNFIQRAEDYSRIEVLDAMASGLESYLKKYAARVARKAASS